MSDTTHAEFAANWSPASDAADVQSGEASEAESETPIPHA